MATTGRGITLIDNASTINPIQTPFNALANSVDAAIDDAEKRSSVKVSSASSRDSRYPVPSQGDRVFRTDLGYEEVYLALRSTGNPAGATPAGWYPVYTNFPGIYLAKRIAPVTSGTQAGITTTPTQITGSSLTVTLSATATLRFMFQLTTYSSKVEDVVIIQLRRAGTSIGDFTRPANSSPTLPATSMVHTLTFEKSFAAGTHAFDLAVFRAAGSGSITVVPQPQSPTIFSIDRIET